MCKYTIRKTAWDEARSFSIPNWRSTALGKVRAQITAVGMYMPEKHISNHDLSELVKTSDEWIRERTGIVERRFVSDKEANSDLSV